MATSHSKWGLQDARKLVHAAASACCSKGQMLAVFRLAQQEQQEHDAGCCVFAALTACTDVLQVDGQGCVQGCGQREQRHCSCTGGECVCWCCAAASRVPTQDWMRLHDVRLCRSCHC
jgi:hypothetical protein